MVFALLWATKLALTLIIVSLVCFFVSDLDKGHFSLLKRGKFKGRNCTVPKMILEPQLSWNTNDASGGLQMIPLKECGKARLPI